jgi:ABC-type multidrug transport system ATPase subunit
MSRLPAHSFPKKREVQCCPCKEIQMEKFCLSATVKVGKETVEKPLLVEMSGHVMAGEVVAIMGGSCAGRSTLLNTLAGRIGPGKLSGDLLVDGHPRNPSTWKIQCAYVVQDDIMFRNLSQ